VSNLDYSTYTWWACSSVSFSLVAIIFFDVGMVQVGPAAHYSDRPIAAGDGDDHVSGRASVTLIVGFEVLKLLMRHRRSSRLMLVMMMISNSWIRLGRYDDLGAHIRSIAHGRLDFLPPPTWVL
jgi:hypothetical protein